MRLNFLWHRKAEHDFIVDRRGRVRRAGQPSTRLKVTALATVGAVAVITPAAGVGEALIVSSRAMVANAAEMIQARSPGLRRAARLTDTKFVSRPAPVMRVAPRVRAPAPPAPAAVAAPPPPAIPLAFASGPLVPPGPVAFAGPFLGPGVAPPLPGPEGFATVPEMLRGGGLVFGPGSVAPPPPVDAGPTPPSPPPSIPEPDTWALMIIGFAVVGTLWRRRKAILPILMGVPRLFYAPAL